MKEAVLIIGLTALLLFSGCAQTSVRSAEIAKILESPEQYGNAVIETTGWVAVSEDFTGICPQPNPNTLNDCILLAGNEEKGFTQDSYSPLVGEKVKITGEINVSGTPCETEPTTAQPACGVQVELIPEDVEVVEATVAPLCWMVEGNECVEYAEELCLAELPCPPLCKTLEDCENILWFPEETYKYCEQDSDCIRVSGSLCPCVGGGGDISINKKYNDYWEWRLGEIRPCQARIETCFTETEPGCINNRCELVEKPEEKYVGAGETFTVSLDCNPSTGYTWEITKIDSNLVELAGQNFQSGCAEPMPGCGGTCFFTFEALKEGSTELEMVYCHSWECEETTFEAKRITVSIS